MSGKILLSLLLELTASLEFDAQLSCPGFLHLHQCFGRFSVLGLQTPPSIDPSCVLLYSNPDEQVGNGRQLATANFDNTKKKNIRRKWKRTYTLLATWNVRTLLPPGKLENVIRERERFKWNILGLLRYMERQGTIMKDGRNIFFSGKKSHTHCVGFIVEKSLNQNINDRVALLKLKVPLNALCILQVHAPTADADDTEIAEFYEQMDSALKHCKNNELLIVMGDFNAEVGDKKSASANGGKGLGSISNRRASGIMVLRERYVHLEHVVREAREKTMNVEECERVIHETN